MQTVCQEPNVFQFSESLSAKLLEITKSFPHINSNEKMISNETIAFYRSKLRKIPEIELLIFRIKQDLATIPGARGYLILDKMFAANDKIPFGDFTLLTALCSLAGQPFLCFNRWPIWKPIGTNLQIDPKRATGVGYIPFHVDVVNAENPPGFTCFYCEKSDLAGGGKSIVSNFQQAITKLSASEIKYLMKPLVSEGKFSNLAGVGKELNPFPVLEPFSEKLWRVRFTAKVIPELQEGNKIKELLLKLEDTLVKNQEVFLLKEGQLLINNQTIVAHGRLPLGKNQHLIPLEKRRLIYQLFMHYDQLYETSPVKVNK